VYTNAVYAGAMKNITFSADEQLIEAARERARTEHTTLNEKFRQWLADYTQSQACMHRYDEVMATLRGRLHVGRKLTREQMNER
jgi:hypothetical protein